jgi:hypothetical protein
MPLKALLKSHCSQRNAAAPPPRQARIPGQRVGKPGPAACWEQRLGATAKNAVAQIVGDTRGWPPGDPRRKFLDDLWAAAKGMTNAAHHESGQPAPFELMEPEARAHLLVTAGLSEWLTAVVGRL